PRITVLVSINEPKGNHFGGVVAAPAFREIVRQTLPYLRVAPQGQKGPVVITKEESADSKKTKGNLKTAVAENAPNVAKESPKAKALKALPGASAEIPTELTEVEEGSYRLPDWSGKPLREVLRNWKDSELKLVVEGSGLCIGQSPPAGQIVKKGAEVK